MKIKALMTESMIKELIKGKLNYDIQFRKYRIVFFIFPKLRDFIVDVVLMSIDKYNINKSE